MAEQSNCPLVTPEKKEFGSKRMGKNSAGIPCSPSSGRVARRSSTGSCHNGDNARRNSSEKPDSAKISQHMIPNYLRASSGSCHDICKYGRRHASEEKAMQPLRKRTTKPSLNELNSIDIIVSGKQKEEKVVKHEPSADAKKHSLLVKPSPDAKSFSPENKASLDAKTHPRRLHASSGGNTRLPNLPIKRERLLPKKVEVPMKEDNSVDNKMSRTDKKAYDRFVKDSSSVRSKPVEVKSSSASDSKDGIHGKGRRNNDVQTGRKTRAAAMSANKTLVPAAAPSFPKLSLSKTASNEGRKSGRVRSLSPRKDQNQIDGVETEASNSQVPKNNALESVTDDHAIPAVASPSSHVSLFHEEDDEEIKYSGNETVQYASDKMVSMEIGMVKPVEENREPLGMGTEENASESIPDGHAIPTLTSQLSPKSPSHAKPQSLLCHEEDDEEIKYSGNDADESVTDNIISMETFKVQPAKENQKENLRMGTEDNGFKSIRDGHPIPALPSPSPSTSLSHSRSPSLLSDEEDDEEIEHTGNAADKLVSGNTVTVGISKAKPLKGNNNMNRRKIRVVGSGSGDKYCRLVKLKLRSAKLVSLHHDNKVRRRQTFRRTRVSGNNGKADDSVSDKKKSVEIGDVQPVKENNKILRKSEDKSRSPVRVFRSEKLVGIQLGNNIPWRLRFRRARVHGVEDGEGDSKTNIEKAAGKDDAAGADISSRKVDLKHEDLHWKKYAQCLLNNVIEETASKLVESRKSKVKALVGAFETVISLQERKPSFRLRTAS